MKKTLLVPDSAPGLPPAPVLAPALTVDTEKLLAAVNASIAALEKDAAILPPLLGFALNSLRGAATVLTGHNLSVKK